MLACWSVKTHGTRIFQIAQSLTTHASTQGQVEWRNIIDKTHTWQQCSVTTSEDILTTKYGFNLKQNSPLSIDNNTGPYAGWMIRVSVTHALIGPQ